MSQKRLKYELTPQVWDGDSMIDEKNFYHQNQGEPSELTRKLTYILGDDNSNYPIMMMTASEIASKGASVGLQDVQFTYPVMGRDDKASVVAESVYTVGDRPGLGNSRFKVRFTDNWNDVVVSGAGNTNVWMNLVGVYTVSNAYIYLNGVLAATKGSGFTYTGTGPLIIGRQGELNGEYFDGRISNVLIYNRALSAAEVSQNYQATKTRFGL